MKPLVVVLLLAACANGTQPAEPVWGKEPCAHCMMLLSEKAPAAQLVLADGSRKFFDDVGCMVAYVDREHVTPQAQWVHLGEGWGRAEQAHYARAHTPMDFGYVGADDGVAFAQVQAAVRAKTSAPSGVSP